MPRPKSSSKPQAKPTRVQRRRVVRARKAESEFKNVRCEGGILSVETLARITAGEIEGLRPEDYKLDPGERLNERVTAAWGRVKNIWNNFKQKRALLPQNDFGTSLTRQAFLIPLLRVLEYGEAEYVKQGFEVEGKNYPISHRVSYPVAVHLVSFKQDLDSRNLEEKAGSRISPHSLMQEYLNQEKKYLWGFVSNGLKFRILRDNISFVHAAYIEFDLETILETDSYGDFFLFYLLTQSSRVARRAEAVETPLEQGAKQGDEGEESAEPQEVDTECWLEKWHNEAKNAGVRALDGLCAGVIAAINALGSGFLERRENTALREALRSGELSPSAYYQQLLRLVYRAIFLQIAEDRGLFFSPEVKKETREIYMNYYSISRLRKASKRRQGGRHYDLWEQLKQTLRWCADGNPELGIPALGSALFADGSSLEEYKLGNAALLAAIRNLTHTTKNNVLEQVDYRNLGVEELGSVYESLLELHPQLDSSSSFKLKIVAGNERKTTGSFYTPPSLVSCLLDTALVPVMEEALAKASTTDAQERALLGLKLCDPACGSGHFLIGAARRIGKKLAQIRSGDEEPAPDVMRRAVRDAIANCLYGVDINPMAVELCKVALWIESMEPGKALMFLDHRLKCGNSFLGATPELIAKGLPDEAFEPLTGDDKKACSDLKKANKKEREDAERGQGIFDFDEGRNDWSNDYIAKVKEASTLKYDTAADYQKREELYTEGLHSVYYSRQRALADLWCAAFVWEKPKLYGDFIPTHLQIDRCRKEGLKFLSPYLREKLAKIVDEYQFFHWYLEFPEVFDAQGRNGFNVVFGNPPWERVKLQEKEWFAQRVPEIANASNKAVREKMIKALDDPSDDTGRGKQLLEEFHHAQRKAEAASKFIRLSGRFPLCGRGDVNTYSIFAELTRTLVDDTGRIGYIVPSGIATDDTTKLFFQDMIAKNVLRNLYDFENRKGIFPGVHRLYKFSLLTISGSGAPKGTGAKFAFFNHAVGDINDEGREFTLDPEDINAINPNTGTCPIFRSIKDAELTKAIYRRVPVLIKEKQDEKNPWGISFTSMFHMSGDSHLFHTREELEAEGFRLQGARFARQDDGEVREFWPLYEAKMTHHYNHRFGDYNDLPQGSKSTQLPDVPVERLQDPNYAVLPRYWVEKGEVVKKIGILPNYLIGFRGISGATNERTFISSIIPAAAVGHSYPIIGIGNEYVNKGLFFISEKASLVQDFVIRQKVGGINISFFMLYQLPTLYPSTYAIPCPFSEGTFGEFIFPRAMELTYTAADLRGFAQSYGDEGAPYRWDEERRFLLRCELDALFFGLYLGFGSWSEAREHEESPEALAGLTSYFPTPLDALDHVMGTFPIVKRKELSNELKMLAAQTALAQRGLSLDDRYPTHAVVRAIYQEMCAAVRGNCAWKTWLDPAPADDSLRY